MKKIHRLFGCAILAAGIVIATVTSATVNPWVETDIRGKNDGQGVAWDSGGGAWGNRSGGGSNADFQIDFAFAAGVAKGRWEFVSQSNSWSGPLGEFSGLRIWRDINALNQDLITIHSVANGSAPIAVVLVSSGGQLTLRGANISTAFAPSGFELVNHNGTVTLTIPSGQL